MCFLCLKRKHTKTQLPFRQNRSSMNPLVSCLSLDDAGSDEGEGRAPYTTSYAQDSATKATINESGFSGVFALEYPLVKSVPEVHASSVTKRKIVHPLISPSAQMKPYDHDGRKKSVLYRIPDVDIVEVSPLSLFSYPSIRLASSISWIFRACGKKI